MTAEGPATLLLSVLIAGNLTLVPITITINQLVLSREFGKPHGLRKRDDGVRRLRNELKEVADTPLVPPAPEAFLRELVETIDANADAVHEAIAATDDDELRRRADTYQHRVDDSTGIMRRALEHAEFGSFELVSAMLEVNSAWLTETLHYLRDDHAEAMRDAPFDDLEEALRLFNVSRQYTKTLYMQKEIATLSRLLLYVGFVAVLTSSVTMLMYSAPIEVAVPSTALLAGFSLLGAVVFAPLAFLLSYMLRLSTIVSYPPLRNSFITDG